MEKREICFATFARNEKVRLPIWLKHYSQFSSKEDIYVFDQNTDDGSTSNIECNVIPEPNEKVFDHSWIQDMINRRHKWLLERYKIVVFMECDELIITKNSENLRDYLINKLKTPNKLAIEIFDIVQNEKEGEVLYDDTIKISNQRKYWRPWTGAHKSTISSIEKNINIGFHGKDGCEIDNNLVSIHIQLLNIDFFRQKINDRLEESDKHGKGDDHACWDIHYKRDMIDNHINEAYSLMEEVPDWFKNNKWI
jgi:hypothetical protein